MLAFVDSPLSRSSTILTDCDYLYLLLVFGGDPLSRPLNKRGCSVRLRFSYNPAVDLQNLDFSLFLIINFQSLFQYSAFTLSCRSPSTSVIFDSAFLLRVETRSFRLAYLPSFRSLQIRLQQGTGNRVRGFHPLFSRFW